MRRQRVFTLLAWSWLLCGCPDALNEADRLAAGVQGPRTFGVTKTDHGYFRAVPGTSTHSDAGMPGYWITEVNQDFSLCLDGSLAPECFVARLDLPDDLTWQPQDLLHGQVETATDDPALGVLVVDAVLQPVGPAHGDTGTYMLVGEERISCSAPCPPTLNYTTINALWFDLVGKLVFPANEPATREQLEQAFWAEMLSDDAFGAGAVVFGRLKECGDLPPDIEIQSVYRTLPSAGL